MAHKDTKEGQSLSGTAQALCTRMPKAGSLASLEWVIGLRDPEAQEKRHHAGNGGKPTIRMGRID